MKNTYRSLKLVGLIFLFVISFGAISQGMVMEEVVVTAEKRAESLQDVSKAVTAIDSEEIETKNLIDFVGLSAIAPGVTVAKNEGYKTIISIRGVGDETCLLYTSPSPRDS